MNGFTAADMTDARAKGYQDRVEHDKEAAAKEAVAIHQFRHHDSSDWYDVTLEDHPHVFNDPDFIVRTVYAAPVAAAPVVTTDEREWLRYAIDHMRDDNEPEDATCANVLEAMLARVDSDDRNPIADLVEGMSVSVDVDRLFDTDGRRLFGTVTEAMWDLDDKHGLTLLVQDAEPNWDASTPAAPGIDLRVRELVARRLRQWRTHIPSDQATPGTREIRTYDHPGLEGETDYNNDVAIWREACSVLDEALTLIDASPKGGEHFQDRLAEIEGRPRPEPEVDEVEEVAACLGDDAAAMLDENPEDERALNMQRAAELLTELQATSAEVGE